jgi:hypothetical protein
VRLYGQRYEVYVPQHYAGLAAWRQGDCTGALRYWSQGGNATFIQGFPDLASVEQEGKSACSSASQVATTEKPPVVTRRSRIAPIPGHRRSSRRHRLHHRWSNRTVQLSRDALILKPWSTPTVRSLCGCHQAEPQVPTQRLRWHMLTLRAAAAFTLAESGADDSATAIARKAVTEARASDATLKPDPDYFSPRFIAFFQGG